MNRRGPQTVDNQARYNIGALEQRVYGVEQSLTNISAQIGTLASKIDARSATNWPVLIGFGGFFLSVIVAIGTLAYFPIREAQTRTDIALSRIGDTTLTRNEFAVAFSAGGQRRDDLQRFNEARFTRIEKDADDIQKALVPRGEHEQRYASIAQRESDLQRQIDDQKKAFGDTFSLRDALQQMQRRIDFLEGRPHT